MNVAASEIELHKLFTIRKTVMEMLRDRDYFVPDFEINLSKDDFRLKFSDHPKREDLFISKSKKNNDSDQIYVFFHEEPKVGVKAIKIYAQRMESAQVFKAILVVQEKLTPLAQHCIDEVISNKFHIEVFQEAELMINVTKHVQVPEHRILTESEKKALFDKYNTVKETQLPRIQVTDPVARYFGMKRGQIVRIARVSETAGKYVNYRYVI